MARPEMILSYVMTCTSDALADANVILRSSTGVANVSASMSSVAVAYTRPSLASAAHWASASQGASITGHPMSLSSFLQSSFSFVPARTRRFSCLDCASASPSSLAALRSVSAFSRFSRRFSSSPDLRLGGLPSNTYTGLMPSFRKREVRLNMPWMCDVVSPASLVSCWYTWPSPPWRTAIRNW
jgi:hypothetical protein